MDSSDLVQTLQAEIGDLFIVEDRTADFQKTGGVRFRGRLLIPAADAYARLQARFEPYQLVPVLRREGDQDVLFALPAGLVAREARDQRVGRPWLNLVLFVATVVTVLMAGIEQSTGNFWADLLSGWPFAVGMLGILLTHEFGHYFASRYHGISVSLPYFIPVPLISPLGTFGAVIINKGPIKDRRALLDVGAAGPLAGLIVAIPVLLIGLALSTVEPLGGQCSPQAPCLMEGNSILYLGLKYLVFGQILPAGGLDVMIHPVAFAGWAGILVTMLNLLPVGTLDGGHVAYALLGEKARYLFIPVLLALVGLGFLWNGWWLWAGLVLIFGRIQAQPLDAATPLDLKRKLIAVVALLVFVLTFTPLPMTILT